MSSGPSRSDSGSGSPARSYIATPPAAKKRPRLVSFTPADLLRQRKRRGGAAAGLSSARKLAGSIRSSPLTPSKARGVQVSGLVLPDGSASPSASVTSERKKKQASSMSVAATGGADSDDDDTSNYLEARGGSTANTLAPADGMADDIEDDEDDDAQGGRARGVDEDTMNLIKQSKEEIKELWDQMSDDQRQRFDVYRRTALNKASIKKLVGHILNQQVTPTLTFVVAGFSKVFVGEIVERAVQIQAERGDTGSLTPDHLREAYRLYKKETQTTASSSGFTKRLF
ncbi:transcription initiation factor TFIID subunit 11 [Coemansia sp. RSA 2611]|uniref:Transcription initiation factor TFIID subunit 11 n=1 Tax=Coemansia linderi TaxID=2663919 RepID=A0ACC1KJB7_9FUNG|nr:transcription initiation factor TFIID subunit 11 [Coemansia sp. RSA 2675]KAJ2385117.1 transcription initiation factor TFIID subunit 11 [Coemansia sp. RSA 2611]KAJ2790438.1 transcription initiation factor TFIID subunit 11 [Coemansia linderi]